MQGVGFLFLNIILRFGIEFGISKQNAGATSLYIHSLSFLPIDAGHPLWIGFLEMLPIIVLSMVTFLVYKHTSLSSWGSLNMFCIMGTVLSYMLIAIHWVSESNFMTISLTVRDIGKNIAPRLVYAIGLVLLVILVFSQIFYQKVTAANSAERLTFVTITMISAWSSTVLILLGRQGPFVALICISGGILSSLNFYTNIWFIAFGMTMKFDK